MRIRPWRLLLSAVAALALIPALATGAGRPDLRVTMLVEGPSHARPGDDFGTAVTVANRGQAQARASITVFYLTGGPTGDARIKLGELKIRRLRPGGHSTEANRFEIPASTPPGDYRTSACADDKRRLSETNERNNCRRGTYVTRVAPPGT